MRNQIVRLRWMSLGFKGFLSLSGTEVGASFPRLVGQMIPCWYREGFGWKGIMGLGYGLDQQWHIGDL